MILASVDPGADYYAISYFENGRLIRVAMQPTNVNIDGADELAIERMRMQPGPLAQQNDVLDVAQSAGWVARSAECPVTWYAPHQWKGSVPKTTHQEKIKACLDFREKALIEHLPKTKLKHILDAVGIGLFHLNRMTREGQAIT